MPSLEFFDHLDACSPFELHVPAKEQLEGFKGRGTMPKVHQELRLKAATREAPATVIEVKPDLLFCLNEQLIVVTEQVESGRNGGECLSLYPPRKRDFSLPYVRTLPWTRIPGRAGSRIASWPTGSASIG